MEQDRPREAADVLFNLPGYRVLDAGDATDSEPRWVLIEPVDLVGHCPDCGFDSSRVHARPVSVVADVAVGGRLEVRVRKRRLVCGNNTCDRRTFVQVTDEIGFRSRITTRLVDQVITALAVEPRSVSAVAAEADLSWRTVMALLTATVDAVHDPDTVAVQHLGVDEHRFRRMRFVKIDAGPTVKIDPWSIVFTDLTTGLVVDVVDGRRGSAVRAWLAARPEAWKARIRLVAIDMSSEFRAAIRKALPDAQVVADHWHVISRANLMVTTARQRRSWEIHGRRGRIEDPVWKYRKLLTCRHDRLSVAQRARLDALLAADEELAVAWAVKELVVQVMATSTRRAFNAAWKALQAAVAVSTLPEVHQLMKTLTAWQGEIRAFCLTRVTNARSEAANLNAKNLKRAGRGYTNHDNYRTRILLATAVKQAA